VDYLGRRVGSHTLQAAIAAVHAEAESVAATDWRQIVGNCNGRRSRGRSGADVCCRLGRTAEARSTDELALIQQEPERQFVQEWIRQLK